MRAVVGEHKITPCSHLYAPRYGSQVLGTCRVPEAPIIRQKVQRDLFERGAFSDRPSRWTGIAQEPDDEFQIAPHRPNVPTLA